MEKPKDMSEALLEQLERASDELEQAYEEFLRTIERLPRQQRQARREEVEARLLDYVKHQRDLISKARLGIAALNAPPPKKPS